jgi:hypothetical protein
MVGMLPTHLLTMVAQSPELWFNAAMFKAEAIKLLGGTIVLAAKEVGISYQAVDKWPDELPRRIADRVLAAVARRHLPAELIGSEARPHPAEEGGGAATERRDPSRPQQFPDLDRHEAIVIGEG